MVGWRHWLGGTNEARGLDSQFISLIKSQMLFWRRRSSGAPRLLCVSVRRRPQRRLVSGSGVDAGRSRTPVNAVKCFVYAIFADWDAALLITNYRVGKDACPSGAHTSLLDTLGHVVVWWVRSANHVAQLGADLIECLVPIGRVFGEALLDELPKLFRAVVDDVRDRLHLGHEVAIHDLCCRRRLAFFDAGPR